MTTTAEPGARAYVDDVEVLPRDRLEELQEERILELVPYAYERSALYREIWDAAGVHPRDIRTMADFREKIPFIDKDDVRDFRARTGDPYGGLLCVRPGELEFIGTTSGTTGNPTPVPQQPLGPTATTFGRDLRMLGAQPGDHFTYLMFSFRAGHRVERGKAMGITPIYLTHSPADIPVLIDVSRRYRPTTLMLLSTPMMWALDRYAAEHRVDLREVFSSYRGIVFGGEPLGTRARAKLDEWGVKVHILTSFGDVATSQECQARDGCHIWEDIALVEHLDPEDGTDVPDNGRGEMVVTALTDRAAPLIRYRTDDIVRLTRQVCPCGRTHGRQWPLGRKSDELVVDGRSVLPIDIWMAIESLPATENALFQIIRPRRDVDELRLRVGHDPAKLGPGGLTGLHDELVAAIRDVSAVTPRIDLVENDELLKLGPPHKIPRVAKA